MSKHTNFSASNRIHLSFFAPNRVYRLIMGGGSQGNGGGSAVSQIEDCRNVNKYVSLASPKSEIEEVSEGDVLRVRKHRESVVVVTEDGEPVGAISEIWTADLIDCIDQGYSYEAEVLALSGGTCRVNVRNREG